jgi:hypothetical protein
MTSTDGRRKTGVRDPKAHVSVTKGAQFIFCTPQRAIRSFFICKKTMLFQSVKTATISLHAYMGKRSCKKL